MQTITSALNPSTPTTGGELPAASTPTTGGELPAVIGAPVRGKEAKEEKVSRNYDPQSEALQDAWMTAKRTYGVGTPEAIAAHKAFSEYKQSQMAAKPNGANGTKPARTTTATNAATGAAGTAATGAAGTASDGSVRGGDPLKAESYYFNQNETPSVNSTVAGQLAAITGKNSGLMQRAKAAGLATAAARGLINSSLAANASQAAVYDRMLPIAQQDASTSSQFQLNERQYKQNLQQSAFNMNQQFEQDLRQFGYQKALTQLQGSIAAAAQQAAFENTGALNAQNAQLNIDQAYALHPLEMAALKAQLDSQKELNQSGVSNTLTLGLADRLAAIDADSTLTPAQQLALRQRAGTDFLDLTKYAGGISTDLNSIIGPPPNTGSDASTTLVTPKPATSLPTKVGMSLLWNRTPTTA